MARVFRLSDRIELDFEGGLKVKIAPLSRHQKHQIQDAIVKGNAVEGASLAVKFAVKSIQGLEDVDGNPYELSFENGVLTDECLEDLFNMEESARLTATCVNLLNSVGQDLPEGVSLAEKKYKAQKN